MIAPVVRLSIGIARLFQDVFVGERKWFRLPPGTPQYEAWQRAKDAAAIKSSGQTGSGLSAQGAGLSSTSISYACVNCDTHRDAVRVSKVG